jgi:hypothetical protein
LRVVRVVRIDPLLFFDASDQSMCLTRTHMFVHVRACVRVLGRKISVLCFAYVRA